MSKSMKAMSCEDEGDIRGSSVAIPKGMRRTTKDTKVGPGVALPDEPDAAEKRGNRSTQIRGEGASIITLTRFSLLSS